MNQAEQQQLVRRVLAHVDARTTDAREVTTTQPAAPYADPRRHAAELAMMRSLPMPVAHVSHVAAPGDHRTVEAGGWPVLLVRADDGVLHAHVNVCRHRGSRLVEGPGGRGCTRFVCPYHAWTYAADGRLVGIPHRGGFPGVDADSHGLRRVTVAEHGGMVFVRADGGPIEDLPGWLGGTAAALQSQDVAGHVVAHERRVQRALDWKLAIDIFLEAYHLRTAHAASIYPLFFDNLGLVDFFGPHQRGVFPKRTITSLREVDPSHWRLRDHANVLLHLFPNTLALLQADHVSVLHVLPRGPGRCEIGSYTLVPEAPTTDKARAYWDANNAILYEATDEDFERGASIQSSIDSGALDTLTFGRFEHGLAHFHAALGVQLAARSEAGAAQPVDEAETVGASVPSGSG